VDHAGEGIWAEVFLTALQSLAFIETDPDTLLDRAEAALPEDSAVRRAACDTRVWWRENPDWLCVREKVLARWGHENMTDVVMNLAFIVLGWLAGNGDFSRSICIATNCGSDTDCTAATVGALLGILDPESIPERWLAPIGRELVVSREIVGIHPPATLDGFTELVSDLRDRLVGQAPNAFSAEKPLDEFAFTAKAAFVTDLPAPGSEAPLLPPDAAFLRLPGTVAGMPREDFQDEVLLLQFSFRLDHAQKTRVMFNTHEACRVWVDGEYAFGRDGGAMGPSPHRWDADQMRDIELSAGAHTLLAAVRRPPPGRDAEWVVAAAIPETQQWLLRAFR